MPSKQMVAACVSPFDTRKKAPVNVLAASFYAVMYKAWGDANLGKLMQTVESVLCVEGTSDMLQVGSLLIVKMQLEVVDEVVELYLSNTSTAGEDEPTPDLMFCIIGSSVFCQDVARLLGLDREGNIKDPLFERFTEQIAHAEPGGVVWVDMMTGGPFYTGNIADLFMEAKRNNIIPG